VPAAGQVHHYRFGVYALPGPVEATSTDDAIAEIRQNAIDSGTLVGTYQR
jgi:phosphatidylethanolamine-binding protein (PEBP) family uncharacterized protein